MGRQIAEAAYAAADVGRLTGLGEVAGDAGDLARKIKLGASRQAREQAYLDYQPLLVQKGIRDDQMRIADLTFRKLIDEYPRQ